MITDIRVTQYFTRTAVRGKRVKAIEVNTHYALQVRRDGKWHDIPVVRVRISQAAVPHRLTP